LIYIELEPGYFIKFGVFHSISDITFFHVVIYLLIDIHTVQFVSVPRTIYFTMTDMKYSDLELLRT